MITTTRPLNKPSQSKSLDKTHCSARHGKQARLERIQRMVQRYLPDFAHNTTSVKCVKRDDVAKMLHLTKSFKHDAHADHVLQQLISLGIIPRCTRRNGVRVFDRDELVAALEVWTADVA